MRRKMEDFLVIDKGAATEQAIEEAKEELKKDAENGYSGKYVQDSIVFKVYERDPFVYISAEWEEEEA